MPRAIDPKPPAPSPPEGWPALDREGLDDDDLIVGFRSSGWSPEPRSARGVSLESGRLEGADLAGASLDRVAISDLVLTRCDLAN